MFFCPSHLCLSLSLKDKKQVHAMSMDFCLADRFLFDLFFILTKFHYLYIIEKLLLY